MAETKKAKKDYTPREIASLAVKHYQESERLRKLRQSTSAADTFGESSPMKECEREVQRLEIELLRCGAWG